MEQNAGGYLGHYTPSKSFADKYAHSFVTANQDDERKQRAKSLKNDEIGCSDFCTVMSIWWQSWIDSCSSDKFKHRGPKGEEYTELSF